MTMQNRIREARRRIGLTQGELGAMIGRSAMFVSDLEHGKTKPGSEMIAALASALGVREAWLAVGDEPMTDHELIRDRRTIGERLRQVRKERKLNQTAFGAMLGVKRVTISLLERNRISASPKMIAAAVERLGIDEHWLRTGERTSEKAREMMAWLATHPEDREIIRAWLMK